MGNRAVITAGASDTSPAIYVHWNGGYNSVSAFMEVAKWAGLPDPRTNEGMDSLANILARRFFKVRKVGDLHVYRKRFGDSRKGLGDNGVYFIDQNWNIVDRKYQQVPEYVNSDSTKEITGWIMGQLNPLTISEAVSEG